MILFGFAQPGASFSMASQPGVVHLAEPGSVLFQIKRCLSGEGVHQASLATSKVSMQSSG
jgi:hypothetical protein